MIIRGEKMEYKKLSKFVDTFFEDSTAQERIFLFSEPLRITKQEFKELIGLPDSTNITRNNDIVLEEFVYDENENVMVKMQIEYYVIEDYVYLLEMSLWREKRK